MNKLILTEWKDSVLSALWTDGKISRLSLDRREEPSMVNRIYVGKVKNVVKNINAAFVEFQGGVIGYYSLTENREHLYTSKEPSSDPPRPGDELIVQVEKDAVKTKAPVLTGQLSFPGKYTVLTMGKSGIGFSLKITDREWKKQKKDRLQAAVPQGCGLIVRTNAYEASAEELLEEIGLLEEKRKDILEKARCRMCGSRLDEAPPAYIAFVRDLNSAELEEIITDIPEIFRQLEEYVKTFQPEDAKKLRLYSDRLLPLTKLYSLETALGDALQKQVWLKSGGYLVIEPTEALTVIDVNTGKYSGRKNKKDTIRAINLEAAEEIGRQMILRNLSGIILIDFIDMDGQESREELMEKMAEICRKDPIKTTVVDMTALNLMEVTRKKVKKPLHETVKNSALFH